MMIDSTQIEMPLNAESEERRLYDYVQEAHNANR